MSTPDIPDGKFWARLAGVAAARGEAAEIKGDKHAAENWKVIVKILVALAIGALVVVPKD